MIAEKDTPILKELLRKNDEESTSRSRRGTKRPKDDDFISGPRDTGLNDGPPPPSLSCRSNDSGSSSSMMLQQNQNQRISPTPQLTEEQKKAKLEEEKTERYIKFVTAFSKRARAAMEQQQQQQQQTNSSVNQTTPNPPALPVQRQNSQPMVSTESKGAFQEGDSQIRRMLVSKDGPAVFQPNRGAHNLNAPKRLNRSGSVPCNNMNSQVQQQMHHQHQHHQPPPQLSPQPSMNNQFNQGKPLEVVNVVQVSPRGYQQRSPQDVQMERRRSYGDVNTLQNYVPNSPMSPHFPQNADFQMAKDESKNQFIAPPNRSRNQSLPPADINGQIQSMTSPMQSPVSPMGGPVSPYATSMPSPSGPMMSPVMGPQKNFFGHPTSQMNGPLRVSPVQQGPNNKQGNNGGQMLQVQGSHKTVQSYPNIIGILNPAQRNNQQRFTVQQSRPNFNQPRQQHHRVPASMSHPMSYSQQMSPNPQPLPAQTRMTNNNHQQQYAIQMAPQKQHQQSTLSNDLKDLSLPLLGSNDFSSDLGCLDFLDNEMPLNGAFESTNKLIQ